jgi:hypothetical protein
MRGISMRAGGRRSHQHAVMSANDRIGWHGVRHGAARGDPCNRPLWPVAVARQGPTVRRASWADRTDVWQPFRNEP